MSRSTATRPSSGRKHPQPPGGDVKRFSAEEVDREFEVGGEIFKWQVPYWEDIADRLDKDVAATKEAVKQLDAVIEGKEGEAPADGVETLPDTARGVTEDFI